MATRSKDIPQGRRREPGVALDGMHEHGRCCAGRRRNFGVIVLQCGFQGDDGVLLAMASWETKAQRDAMESSQSEAVQRIIEAQAEFVTIQVIGEFEDPEWVVDPELADD